MIETVQSNSMYIRKLLCCMAMWLHNETKTKIFYTSEQMLYKYFHCYYTDNITVAFFFFSFFARFSFLIFFPTLLQLFANTRIPLLWKYFISLSHCFSVSVKNFYTCVYDMVVVLYIFFSFDFCYCCC